MVLDEGREFMAEFADCASTAGALVQPVDARSPWKNAKTERHGGNLKEIFHRTCELEPPGTSTRPR